MTPAELALSQANPPRATTAKEVESSKFAAAMATSCKNIGQLEIAQILFCFGGLLLSGESKILTDFCEELSSLILKQGRLIHQEGQGDRIQ